MQILQFSPLLISYSKKWQWYVGWNTKVISLMCPSLWLQLFPSLTAFLGARLTLGSACPHPPQRAVLPTGSALQQQTNKSSSRKRRPPGRATQFELLSDFPPRSFFFPEISWRCYLTDSFRRLRSEWQAQMILIWWFIPCDLAKTKASLFWETHQSISQFHFSTARQLPHTSGYHAWTAGCSSPRCWPPRGEPAISDQNKPPPRQPISGKKGNKIHYGELV